MASSALSPSSASINTFSASLSFAPLSGASLLNASVAISPTGTTTATGAPTPAASYSPPRRARRAHQAAHNQPVSEVGMWKARSVAAQGVVDEKVGALDAYRTSDVGPSQVAFQHQSDVASNATGWLAQLRTTVDGSLTLLGAETTAAMLRIIHTVSQDVTQLVTASSAVVASRDKETQLLDDALRATQDLVHCLRSRCEAMEAEYKKLLVAAEKHEGILSKARTYVKVVMAERLAWQESYGANAAKLPLTVTSDFVKRCQRTLDMFHSAQATHALASVVALEQTTDSIKRYQHRVNDRLNEGSVLLRYVPPAEEIQLLDQTLKTSGSDVALHKELADRERKFDKVKDEMFDRCSSALHTVQVTKLALHALSDQLRRMRNDDIIGQLSNRIINAISIASSGLGLVGSGSAMQRSPSISAAAVAVDAASTLSRRRDTAVMGRSSSIVVQQHSAGAHRRSVRIVPSTVGGGGGGAGAAVATGTSPSRGSRLMSATSMVMALQSVARREQLQQQQQPAAVSTATGSPGSGGAAAQPSTTSPSSSTTGDGGGPSLMTPTRTESPQTALHDVPAAALSSSYRRGKTGSVVIQESGINGFRSPSLQPVDLASPSGAWTPRYGGDTLDAHRQSSASTATDSTASGSQPWQPQQLPSPVGSSTQSGREGRARSVFVVDSLDMLHRQRSDSGSAGGGGTTRTSSEPFLDASSRRTSSNATTGAATGVTESLNAKKSSESDTLDRSTTSTVVGTENAAFSDARRRSSAAAAMQSVGPSPQRVDSSSSLTPDASLVEAGATMPPRQGRFGSKVRFHGLVSAEVTLVPAATALADSFVSESAKPVEGIIVPRKDSGAAHTTTSNSGNRGVGSAPHRSSSSTVAETGGGGGRRGGDAAFNVGMPVAGGGGVAGVVVPVMMQSPSEEAVDVDDTAGGSATSATMTSLVRQSSATGGDGSGSNSATTSGAGFSGGGQGSGTAPGTSRSSLSAPRSLPSWNVDNPLPEEASEAERQLAAKRSRSVIPSNIQMVFDGMDAPTFTVDLSHYGVTRQFRRQESMNGKLAEALHRAGALEAQSERLALAAQRQVEQLDVDRRQQELVEEYAEFSQKVSRASLRRAGLGSAQNRQRPSDAPTPPYEGNGLSSGKRDATFSSAVAVVVRRENITPVLPPAPPALPPPNRSPAQPLSDLSTAVAIAVRPATVGGAPQRRRSSCSTGPAAEERLASSAHAR